MPLDPERRARNAAALPDAGVDAFICALPQNVLLLTGYWPVLGTSIALATRAGEVALLVPEDEADLARHGWADRVLAFQPAALDRMQSIADAIREPLTKMGAALSQAQARIGYEAGEASQPAPYAALHVYGAGIIELL